MSDLGSDRPETPAPAAGTDPTVGIRQLSVAGFLGIVVVYLATIQGLGFALTRGLDTSYAAPTRIEELWRGITVPVAASLVFVYAVVAVLGWWRPMLVDHKPVRR
jgi:uncharacterized protein